MFKPLLAATIDPKKDPNVFGKLVWPLLASPKLDGIRCIVRDGRCVSRKLLDLPRPHIQEAFSHLEHMDGEIIVGEATDSDVYNRTQSYVMSKDSREPQPISFHVFDWAEEDWSWRHFSDRHDHLDGYAQRYQSDGINVVLVPQRLVHSLNEMLAFEEEVLSQGYEGIMLRSKEGAYKHNRSTFNEHILLKLKRFEDFEAPIIGFIEQLTNTNEATKDALGNTKRSHAIAGMVPAGTLGKFVVSYMGMELEIPCGVLKKDQRQYVWDHQEEFRGKFLKVRHFPIGAKDKPRLPRAVGFRDPMDM